MEPKSDVSGLVVIDGGRYEKLNLSLYSDTHIGSSNANVRKLSKDLLYDSGAGRRILVNGDVFDAIIPGDRRYDPVKVAKRLQGKAEIVGEAIKWGEDIFGPVYDRIDMLGIGNHETALIRKGGLDPVAELSKRLKVNYGGYGGFVKYTVAGVPFIIHYHHGEGKGSSPHLAIQRLRERTWVDADLYWQGHFHVKASAQEQRIGLDARGRVRIKTVTFVQTGSYYEVYGSGQAPLAASHGRNSSYAADFALRPGGLGRTVVEVRCEGKQLKVEVTQ